jgi:hypothetical protein
MPGDPGRPARKFASPKRLALALATLLLLSCAGGVIWVWLTPKPPRVKWVAAESDLSRVHRALGEYAKAHDGTYPAQLHDLVPAYLEDWALEDPYSQGTYHYERTKSGYLLRCNGADKLEGGAEIPERDIVFDETGQR